MPDLTIFAKLVDGQKTVEGLHVVDKAYQQVGETGKTSFREAEKAASVFGSTMGTVKQLAFGLAAAFGGMEIVGQIRHWTEQAIDFGAEWARTATILDGSIASMEGLKKEVAEMGVDFGTSAERARGLFTVLRAGIDQSKSVEFLTTAMKLAQTSFISTDEAVNLLKVSLRSFEKSTDDAATVAEKLFVIMQKGGGVTAGELSMAFARLAPMAMSLNVSMEDIGVTMGTLKERGMSSMQAFQALNIIMTRMTQEGSKMNKVLEEQGVHLTKDTLRQKGFAYVLSQLKDVIAGDAEMAEQLGLNIRAMGPILAITGSSYDRYMEKLKAATDSKGKEAIAWEKVNSTIKDKWGDLMVAVEIQMVKAIGTGEKFTGMLDEMIQMVESGHPPLNAFTFALSAFGVALAALKLNAFIGGVSGAVAMLRVFIGLFSIEGIVAFGNAIAAATVKMGMLGKAATIAGIAFGTWELTKWMLEVTGLDLKIAGLITRLGFFKTKIPDPTAEMFKGLQKTADILEQKYGPDLEKMGISVQRNNRSYDDWVQALAKANDSLRGHAARVIEDNKHKAKAIELTQQEKKELESLTKEMEKAGAPLKDLSEKMALLQKGGKFNRDEFVTAFSKEIKEGIEMYESLGRAVPPAIAALKDLARAQEDGKAAAQALRDAEKKYVDLLSDEPIMWNRLEESLKKVRMEGYLPNLKIMHDNYAEMLLNTGAVKDIAQAEEEANKWTDEMAKTFMKNRVELIKSTDAINEMIPASVELEQEFIKLGLAAPIGTMGQLTRELSALKDAMQTLGVSDVDKNLEKLERAYETLANTQGMTAEKLNNAQISIMKARIEGNRELSEASLVQLEEWAFGTDRILREEALPVWKEYVEKVKGLHGELPTKVLNQLASIMTGTDKILKQELLPIWQEYVKNARDETGQLPGWLDQMNKQITRQMERESANWEEVWKNQVSTIVTDFSKGVAEMLFEGKSMTETLKGIFKEFGKSVVRTMIEQFFSPLKNMLGDLASGLGGLLTGKGTQGFGGMFGGLMGGGSKSGGGGWKETSAGVWQQGSQTFLGNAAPTGGAGAAGGLGSMFSGLGIEKFTSGAGGGGFFQSGGGIAGKGVGGVGGGLMAGGGMALFMDGIKRGGWGGAAETIGGGAMAGFAMGGPIGAAIGAIAGAIAAGIKAIMGKSTALAGAMESARDFGGVKVGQEQFKGFYEQMGLTAKSAEGIRKDLSSSPQYLVNVLAPLAQAQGKMGAFLASLEHVKTAWGEFDFRKAFEIGQATGDWTKLDEAFVDAYEHSNELQKQMPEWKEMLTMMGDKIKEVSGEFEGMWGEFEKTGTMSTEFVDFMEKNVAMLDKAAESSAVFKEELDSARLSMEKFKEVKPLLDGLQMIKDGLAQMGPVTESVYEHFLQTGEILPELEAQIKEYGGDITKFKALSDLTGENNAWQEMLAIFVETGREMPGFREEIEKFGGALEYLDEAAKLPGLQQKLANIADFRSALQAMLPEMTGLQQVMQGQWGPTTEADLAAQGIDPEKMRQITDLIRMENGWQEELTNMQKDPHLVKGGIIEQALGKFGGAEGLTALERYSKGFAAISPQLLATVKSKMDVAFKAERDKTLDYLDEIEQKTGEEITAITDKINAQFKLVADGIAAAFETARKSALDELDKILAAVNAAVVAAGQAPTVGGVVAPSVTTPDVFDKWSAEDLALQRDIKDGTLDHVRRVTELAATAQDQLTALNTIANNQMVLAGQPTAEVAAATTRPVGGVAAPRMVAVVGGKSVPVVNGQPVVNVDLRGAQIYSIDDFNKRVTTAVTSAYSKGGLQVLSMGAK